MIKETLQKFVAKRTVTIAKAMTKIDENAHGMLFVVDDNNVLLGSLTDGDIRRWLIKTGDMYAPIENAMNQAPKKMMSGEQRQAAAFMKEHHIKAVPIVDLQNRILDIVFEAKALQWEGMQHDLLHDVPVVVMAGGKGTRLYPYTKILPKPLIPIGDIPILERIINRFCDYGAKEFYMTVNYKKNMIKSYFAELNTDYTIEYVEEEKPLGTAGSIKLIEKGFETPIFVTNCDSLIQADYTDMYQYHKTSGNAMTIVSALKNVTVPYGVLNFKEDGVITSMEEKPNLSYFINTGMYIMNPEVIDKIPDDTFFHMTHLVEALMNEGYQVGMYPVSEDSFLDMGEFEEMRRMEAKLNIE